MGRIASNKLHLTKASIESLAIPGTHYDTKQPGLVLNISPQGNKSFGIYKWCRVRKRPVSQSIGKWPAFNVDMARTKAREIIHALDRGEVEASQPKTTFGDLADRYELSLKATGARLYDYISDIVRLSADDWRRKEAATITREMVETRHHEISAKRGAHAAMKFVKGLNTLYKHADLPSPAAKVRVKSFKPRTRIATPEEMAAILVELDKCDPLWRDYFKLVILTGARRGNVQSMRFEDIKDGLWTIPETDAKMGEAIVIPLSDEALKIVEARRAVQVRGYVFPSRSSKGYVAQPWEQWDSIRKAAGIAGLTIHDMRRTFVSRLAEENVHPSVAARLAGHRDIKTTLGVYTQVNLKQMREGLQRIS